MCINDLASFCHGHVYIINVTISIVYSLLLYLLSDDVL